VCRRSCEVRGGCVCVYIFVAKSVCVANNLLVAANA